MNSDEDFKAMLTQIQRNEASEDETDEFNEAYIWLDCVGAQGFSKIKYAAEQGYTQAYYHLGKAYLNGTGCDKNTELGINYLQKSVETGGSGACLLGDLYRLGVGVEKDYAQAYDWYQKAIETRDEEDCSPYDMILQSKSYLDVIIRRKGINLAWWEYVVSRGKSPDAMDELRWLYLHDEKNEERYWYWTRLAVESGSVSAEYDYGKKLLKNPVDEETFNKAIELLKKACFEFGEYTTDAAEAILTSKISDNVKQNVVQWLCKNGEAEEDALLARLYKGHEDDLAYMREMAMGDNNYDDIQEGTFKCPSCDHIYSLDDQNNPDKQGELCNECCYGGRMLEKE